MDKTNSYRVDDDVDTMRIVSILGTFGNMGYHFYCIAVSFMDKPVLEKNMDKLRNRVGYIFDHYRVYISFSPDICPLPEQTFKRRDNNHYYMLFIHPDERVAVPAVEAEAAGNIANKVNN